MWFRGLGFRVHYILEDIAGLIVSGCRYSFWFGNNRKGPQRLGSLYPEARKPEAQTKTLSERKGSKTLKP